MEWDVLFEQEFAAWFETLDEGLQDEIFAYVALLRRFGPNLGRPRVDTVKGSESVKKSPIATMALTRHEHTATM